MRISAKLISGFILIALTTVAVGYRGLLAARSVGVEFHDVSRETIPMLHYLEDMKFAGIRIVSSTNEMCLFQTHSIGTSINLIEKERELIEAGRRTYKESLRRYASLVEKFPDEGPLLEAIRAKGDELLDMADKMFAIILGRGADAEIMGKKEAFKKTEQAYLDAVDTAIRHEEKEFSERMNNVSASIDLSVNAVGGACAVTFLMALVIGTYISRDISRAIKKLKKAAQLVGDGILITELGISSRDEIGDLALTFTKMSKNLTDQQYKRKQAEDKIIHQNNLLNNVIESLTHPFYVIDVDDYRIKLANSAARPGILKEDMTCYALSHHRSGPCEEKDYPCTIKRIQETRKSVILEHIHYDKNGNPGVHEVHGYPVFDDKGRITQVIEYAIDVTETKKLKERLYHAQRMEAVGQLAGGVAHYINNVISAIINYNYIMRDMQPGDPGYFDIINKIHAMTERASHITRSLLSYSRKQFFELEPLDLNLAVKNVELLLYNLAGKNNELVILPSEEDLIIMADKTNIEQCIMNLAANACDAMPDGGRLTIKTEAVEMDGVFINAHGFGMPGLYALLSVTDTGTGMDEATMKKIFEPFFTTKEVGKGTGLGLPMIYGITKQHMGFIDVSSRPGCGTAFKMYFPVVKDKLGTKKQEETSPATGGAEII